MSLPFDDPSWIKKKGMASSAKVKLPKVQGKGKKKESGKVAPGRLVPSNLPLLQAENSYKEKLPKLFGVKSQEVRRFILEDLIPVDLALTGGFLDAKEVGKSAIADDLDIEVIHTHLQKLWQDSIELKLLTFVARTANLNETEVKLLVAKYLMRTAATTGVGGSEIVKQILSSLQPVSVVQRQEEERKALLREISPARSVGRRKPATRHRAGTQRKKVRTS